MLDFYEKLRLQRGLHDMKILAVDDDPIALELLSASLKSAGYREVTLAVSGKSALEAIAAASKAFDCFLLDIQMPGMDGVELCGRIRSIAQYRTAPIIMITAMSNRSFIDGAFAAGAMDYVNKPFDPLELGVRVRLADTLVRERRISNRKIFAAQGSNRHQNPVPAFSIGDAIEISEVPRSVSKLAMENYLLQLSRGRVYQSSAVAFAIVNFEAIFARSTPTEMHDILTDVAEAIVGCLKRTTYLLTYNGYGEFVCVTKRNASILEQDLEEMVQWAIEEMHVTYSDGTRCEIGIVMGDPQTTSLWSAGNPLQLIHNSLVAVAERRLSTRTRKSRSAAEWIAQRFSKAS
jgi:CheY-like chemotaxis protein